MNMENARLGPIIRWAPCPIGRRRSFKETTGKRQAVLGAQTNLRIARPDLQVDVWSLGVVLYMGVCGPPWSSMEEIMFGTQEHVTDCHGSLSGNLARMLLTHVRDMFFISQGGTHVKPALPHVSASKSAGLALGMFSIICDSSCLLLSLTCLITSWCNQSPTY